MNWEYKIVYFCLEPLHNEPGYESSLHDGVHLLNELGGQGWELVQFLAHPLSDDAWKHHAVFKRPRTTPSESPSQNPPGSAATGPLRSR